MSANEARWAIKDWTQGELNALVKKLGGEKVARGILDGTVRFTVEMPVFALYLSDKQQHGWLMRGSAIEADLKETGLINRCISLENEQVKRWIADPSTYPEEYKGKYVYLWKSAQGQGDRREVPYLWNADKVNVGWQRICEAWPEEFFALIEVSAS